MTWQYGHFGVAKLFAMVSCLFHFAALISLVWRNPLSLSSWPSQLRLSQTQHPPLNPTRQSMSPSTATSLTRSPRRPNLLAAERWKQCVRGGGETSVLPHATVDNWTGVNTWSSVCPSEQAIWASGQLFRCDCRSPRWTSGFFAFHSCLPSPLAVRLCPRIDLEVNASLVTFALRLHWKENCTCTRLCALDLTYWGEQGIHL